MVLAFSQILLKINDCYRFLIDFKVKTMNVFAFSLNLKQLDRGGRGGGEASQTLPQYLKIMTVTGF